MKDMIVRAAAGNGAMRAFFASTRGTVEKAREIHGTTPVATAALGRLLTGAVMMGQMLKYNGELVTLQIKGDGELGGILATSSNDGTVKGYVNNPGADAEAKSNGKLNVAGVVGNGSLTVIMDKGLKEPYVGSIPLVSGEIAEDLTQYFADSEQTPSVVALGVLVDRDYSVKQAGGFIVQLLPFVDDDVVDRLEKKIGEIRSVTQMLDSGLTAEGMLEEVLGEFGVEVTDKVEVRYDCNCSRERVEKALISIGKDDIRKILEEDGKTELCCHFCGKKYEFDGGDLMGLLERV